MGSATRRCYDASASGCARRCSSAARSCLGVFTVSHSPRGDGARIGPRGRAPGRSCARGRPVRGGDRAPRRRARRRRSSPRRGGRHPSSKPVTQSSSASWTRPNGKVGARLRSSRRRPTRCASTRRARSMSTSSSPLSASTGPLPRRSEDARRRPLPARAARLAQRDHLGAKTVQLALELLLPPGRARHEHARHARAREPRNRPRGEGTARDRHERGFGRPPAASPSRSPRPPASRSASIKA